MSRLVKALHKDFAKGFFVMVGPHSSEEDKRTTTNVQNRLFFFVVCVFSFFPSLTKFIELKPREGNIVKNSENV